MSDQAVLVRFSTSVEKREGKKKKIPFICWRSTVGELTTAGYKTEMCTHDDFLITQPLMRPPVLWRLNFKNACGCGGPGRWSSFRGWDVDPSGWAPGRWRHWRSPLSPEHCFLTCKSKGYARLLPKRLPSLTHHDPAPCTFWGSLAEPLWEARKKQRAGKSKEEIFSSMENFFLKFFLY